MPDLRRVEHARRDGRARAPDRGDPWESRRARQRAQPVPQSLNSLREAEPVRVPTGIDEMDRVLGGGLVPGSVVLLGGEPGIGKSTLLLQAAAGLAAGAGAASGSAGVAGGPGATSGHGPTGGHVLYATGEESAGQVRLRAGRLGLLDGPAGDRIQVVAESEVGRIVELARELRPAVLVVDSIQTVTSDELEGPAGSVGQVRECALRLMEVAKQDGIAVILVGHVTKDGSLAGPKTLEHLVDAVLSLEGERTGDHAPACGRPRTASARPRRSASSRWPSAAWPRWPIRAGPSWPQPTSTPRAAWPAPRSRGRGRSWSRSRPWSRRAATAARGGRRRASTPIAWRCWWRSWGAGPGVGLGSHDVYANLAGGLDLADPGLDLPLALALASSLRDKQVPRDLIAIGEVGLLGELRPVPGLERRLREAAQAGFGRPSCRAPAGPTRPPSTASRSSPSPTCARRSGVRSEAAPAEPAPDRAASTRRGVAGRPRAADRIGRRSRRLHLPSGAGRGRSRC